MRQILLSFLLTAAAALAAPTINTQPASQTVAQEASVTLTVAATAASGSLSYQWRKDGVSIPSATSASYGLASAQPWHIGDYTVVVTDTSGSVTSSAAALTLTGVPTGLWKGLTGYFPLSGNANDSTAFARNGTLSTTAPTTTTNRFSQATEAYSFNGSSNFISAAAGTPGWPAANADRTVSVWFKTAVNGTAAGNLFSLGARTSNKRFSLLWFNATQPAFIGEGNDQSYTGVSGLADTQWHHCVITYGSNTGKVFMDGVKLTTPVSSWSKTLNTDGTKPFCLGVNADQLSEYFPGSLDDARIYNRALSEAEVAQLFAQEKGASLQVVGNQTLISSGDITPDSADHTAFGNTPAGTPVTRTFTIQNPNPALYIGLGTVTLSGTGAAAYSISSAPAGGGIFPSGSVTLGITFQPATSGVFDAVVTIPNGSAGTPSYTFAISGIRIVAPAITAQPQPVSTTSGQPAAFSVTATGDSLSYQWFKDGAAIPGATSASYSLAPAQPWHIGSYSVQVSNAAGSVTSDSAALTLTGVDNALWSGLVGYYPLDGTADDATAFARHGTITGATTAIGRDGQANKAYAFSGTSQYISAAAGSTGWPGGSSSRTVSLWYKANAHGGNLFSFGQNVANRRFSILLQGTTQTSFISEGNDFAYTTGSQAGTGWHHLVITYGDGGAGVGKVFVDGIQLTNPASSWTKTNLNTDGTQPFRLGTATTAAGEFFNGSLDDVRIYNRALTATEVGQLYTAEFGRSIRVSGNGQDIAAQDTTPASADHTDFGYVASTISSVTRTFTITNSGTTTLSPVVAISGSAAYALTTPPASSVAPGGSTTFTVTFAPTTAGSQTATVSVSSGASRFDFSIQGIASGVGWPDALDPVVANFTVKATAMQPDGKILLGGAFTQVAGVTRLNLARLNADGTLDTAFNPSVNSTVNCITVLGDGKILIAGSFTSVGGVTRRCVARLNADGGLDTTFVDPGVGPSDYQPVYALAVQADGKILIGGDFSQVGGSTRQYIARLGSDGTLDTTFTATANNAVHSLMIQADGSILLGGIFNTVNSTSRTRLARLTAAGVLDSTFAPAITDVVRCITTLPDGKILIGGDFSTVNTAARTCIARLNTDGTLDATFANANLTHSAGAPLLYTVAAQSDGKVIIGGYFTHVAGTSRKNIARLNSDGTLDSTFNPMASPFVYSLSLQADGSVLAGGSFTSLQPDGGSTVLSRPRFARLYNDAASQALGRAGYQQITWTRGGTAPLVEQVSFELSTDDGLTYSLLPGTPQRIGTTAGWQLSGLSLPANGRIRARGRVSGGNGSSSIIEQVSDYISDLVVRGNDTVILHGDVSPRTADHTHFGSISPGSSLTRTYTIQNAGTATLHLTGDPLVAISDTHAADFTLSSPPADTTLDPGDTTTFEVTATPSVYGVRNATLTIPSDDPPLLGSYTFAIRALRLSATTDTDSDGLNDAAEYQMAALGFDWEVNQTALVQTLTDNATTAGLYNLTQVQQVNVGTPILVRDNATGKFKLTLSLQQSTNLIHFTPMSFTSGTTTINSSSGNVEFEFTPDIGSPHFYRVGAQ